jgi:aspartyl-tRNA(Asn)/glutamyl-tRNA(Gln) amidotransferase subunit A
VASVYRRVLQVLRARGDEVCEIALGAYDFGRARRAGLLVVEADLLVEHAEDWRACPEQFSSDLTRFLRYGEKQSAAAYAGAMRTIAAAHVEVARWFAHGDVMLLPTAPQQAFAFGEPVPANQADLTSIANMAGVPAMSVPLPLADGELPIGLQLIAALGAEATLLAVDLKGICAP